jgi:hypothetical protein
LAASAVTPLQFQHLLAATAAMTTKVEVQVKVELQVEEALAVPQGRVGATQVHPWY